MGLPTIRNENQDFNTLTLVFAAHRNVLENCKLSNTVPKTTLCWAISREAWEHRSSG